MMINVVFLLNWIIVYPRQLNNYAECSALLRYFKNVTIGLTGIKVEFL